MIKLNLSRSLIHLMYKFVDVEFSGNVAIVDDRMIEYSYALSRVIKHCNPDAKILDVGCVARINPIPQTLCELGHKVYGVDVRDFLYRHDNFKFIKGDAAGYQFKEVFDVIILVSALEHFGIKGRYGIDENDDYSDYVVIENLHRSLKPEGVLVLTVPLAQVGRKFGLNRIYDDKRVDMLFKDKFTIKEKLYYERYEDILVSRSECTPKTHLLCLTAIK